MALAMIILVLPTFRLSPYVDRLAPAGPHRYPPLGDGNMERATLPHIRMEGRLGGGRDRHLQGRQHLDGTRPSARFLAGDSGLRGAGT
jgi:hypothetical protein